MGASVKRWGKNHDFSNHVQSHVDGTNFVAMCEAFDNDLAGEVDHTITSINRLRSTLKPSQMIAWDVIELAAVQPKGASCTEN